MIFAYLFPVKSWFGLPFSEKLTLKSLFLDKCLWSKWKIHKKRKNWTFLPLWLRSTTILLSVFARPFEARKSAKTDKVQLSTLMAIFLAFRNLKWRPNWIHDGNRKQSQRRALNSWSKNRLFHRKSSENAGQNGNQRRASLPRETRPNMVQSCESRPIDYKSKLFQT